MDTFILERIKNFFSYLPFKVSTVSSRKDEEIDMWYIEIDSEDPNFLIGRNGDILHALDHLVHRFVEKEFPEQKEPFILDVQGYQERKIKEIKTRARIVIDRARSFKRDVSLDPVPAYERLIIHAYASKFSDISTRSEGDGKDRHVIIEYKGEER